MSSLPSEPRRVGRPPGPAVDPAVRRAQLLDAAARVIRRRGPGASMDELAAEAGLSKPILYAAFGDRAGVASALAERFVNEVTHRMAATLARTGSGSPEHLLRDALDAFVGFMEEDPNVYQFIVTESVKAAGAGSTPGIARLRIFDAVGKVITASLSYQLHLAGQDPAKAEPLAFAAMGMVFGASEWWLDRRSMSRDELVDLLSELLWVGLRGRRPQP